MLRKTINFILFLPFGLYVTSQNSIASEKKDFVNAISEKKEDILYINYEDLNKIILNNNELKSLKELVKSSSFNLSSKISKRFPSLDLQANGLPKYVAGRNYNSNTQNTKTSQFSADPSLNIRWDLIDPLRGTEIKMARKNYKIAKNNYEIKKQDLVQEAKSRYHKYQKSFQDINNEKYNVNLSIKSLEDATSKLEAGIGTRFEVLEADAQLSRDKQSLNEKKIKHKINKIALKEILNIKRDFEINTSQRMIGFWNYKLSQNINNGLTKNLELKNLSLQKEIKENKAKNFLNANKPSIYITNSFSSNFSKGDSLSQEIDSSEYGSSYTNTIGLNLSWNIFNGGQNKNSYKSSKAEAQADEYSYDNFKNNLRTNIIKTYLNLKLDEDKILSHLKEISSAKESLRLSRLRYDVGISTLKDVLIRQKELSNAKSNHTNSIYNYNINLAKLERLTSFEINNQCTSNENNKIEKKESICNIPR